MKKRDDGGRLIREDLEPLLTQLWTKTFPGLKKTLRNVERKTAELPGGVWHLQQPGFDATFTVTDEGVMLLGGPSALQLFGGPLDGPLSDGQMSWLFEQSHPIEHCEEDHG